MSPSAGGTSARRDVVALSARDAAVVGWCGMRGTVSLAAALSLPAAFPHGDLILVTAFGVVLGTLVVQGMTLGTIGDAAFQRVEEELDWAELD
jgi:monovalent cation/hydrogen antiporter